MDCHNEDPGYSLSIPVPTLPVVSGSVVAQTNLQEDKPAPVVFPGGVEGRAPPLAWQRVRTVALLC